MPFIEFCCIMKNIVIHGPVCGRERPHIFNIKFVYEYSIILFLRTEDQSWKHLEVILMMNMGKSQ